MVPLPRTGNSGLVTWIGTMAQEIVNSELPCNGEPDRIVSVTVTLGAPSDIPINVPMMQMKNTHCIAGSHQAPESSLPVAHLLCT